MIQGQPNQIYNINIASKDSRSPFGINSQYPGISQH